MVEDRFFHDFFIDFFYNGGVYRHPVPKWLLFLALCGECFLAACVVFFPMLLRIASEDGVGMVVALIMYGHGRALIMYGHGRALNMYGHGRALNMYGHGRALNMYGHGGCT
jgi:hypothetical protein